MAWFQVKLFFKSYGFYKARQAAHFKYIKSWQKHQLCFNNQKIIEMMHIKLNNSQLLNDILSLLTLELTYKVLVFNFCATLALNLTEFLWKLAI